MPSVYQRYYYYLITTLLFISVFIVAKKKASINNYLLILIAIVSLAVELYANKLASDGQKNSYLYNLFTLVEINIYLFVVRNLLSGKTFRKIVLYFVGIFNPIALIRLFFFGGFETFDALTYAVGCFVLCCSCIFYFYELFEYKYAIFILQEPSFWLVTALMFYYTLGIPIFGVWTTFIDPPKFIIANYILIIDSLNFVVYLLINLALLCQIRYNKPITLR